MPLPLFQKDKHPAEIQWHCSHYYNCLMKKRRIGFLTLLSIIVVKGFSLKSCYSKYGPKSSVISLTSKIAQNLFMYFVSYHQVLLNCRCPVTSFSHLCPRIIWRQKLIQVAKNTSVISQYNFINISFVTKYQIVHIFFLKNF